MSGNNAFGRRDFLKAGTGLFASGAALLNAQSAADSKPYACKWYPFVDHPNADTCWSVSTGPDGRIYPWGNAFDGTLANYCDINCQADWKDKRFDDGYTDTSPVGAYPYGASVYGALDMAGNVYEWVADWYGPYSRNLQTNPIGPDAGTEKIIRGGSWGDDSAHVRSSIRSHVNGDTWLDFIGFRCAR